MVAISARIKGEDAGELGLRERGSAAPFALAPSLRWKKPVILWIIDWSFNTPHVRFNNLAGIGQHDLCAPSVPHIDLLAGRAGRVALGGSRAPVCGWRARSLNCW